MGVGRQETREADNQGFTGVGGQETGRHGGRNREARTYGGTEPGEGAENQGGTGIGRQGTREALA
jgi:hypothetical protein